MVIAKIKEMPYKETSLFQINTCMHTYYYYLVELMIKMMILSTEATI